MRKPEQDPIATTPNDIGDLDTDYTDDQHQAANDALDNLGDVTIDLTVIDQSPT